MLSLKTQVRVTLAIAGLALLAGIFSHLALTDIHHANEDLAQEWMVLQFSAMVILAFIITTVLTLNRVLRQL
jgi:hypothetical protein